MIYIIYYILASSLVNPTDPATLTSSFGMESIMETSNLQVSPVINLSDPTLTPSVQEELPSPTVLEETLDGSQLPLNTKGTDLSRENWKKFWQVKKNRKHFHKTSDMIKKVQVVVSKVWFLAKCLSLKVIPVTLQPNLKHSEHFSEQGHADWEGANFRAGNIFLRSAMNEEKVHLLTLREGVLTGEKELYNLAGMDTSLKVHISEKLRKIGRSYLKQQNNHHRQKLRNLLSKRKMNIPEYLNKSGASCINLSDLSNLSTDTNTSRKFEK